MAASIKRQVAQELKRRLRDKKTTHAQAIQLVKWIAVFQGLSTEPESSPSEVQDLPVPSKQAEPVLGGLT